MRSATARRQLIRPASSLLLSVNKKRHRARHYHKHHSKTSLQSQKTYNPSFLIKKMKVFFRAYAESKLLDIVLDVKNAQPFRLLGSLFAVPPPPPLSAFLPPCWWCRSLELSVSESGHLNYDQKYWRAGYKGRFSFNFRLEIQRYSGHR